MRYHGNYCGPNWSAGKHQESVKYGVGPAAVDEFDETCRQHDDAYARGRDLKKADYLFYRKNIGKGWKRSAAALAVGLQGYFRSSKKINNSENIGRIMPPVARNKRKRSNSGSSSQPAKRRRLVQSRSRKSSVRRRGSTVSVPPRRTTTMTKKRTMRFRPKAYPLLAATMSNKVMGKHQKRGVTYSVEWGKNEVLPAGKTAIYLGHTTSPQEIMQRYALGAIAKKILNKVGMAPTALDQLLPSHIGDRVFIVTRDNQNPGTAKTFTQYVFDGTDSVNDIIQTWYVALRAKTSCLYIEKTYFLPKTPTALGEVSKYPYAEINLINATLEFDVKSVLRMQNRTTNKSGQINRDDVTAIPLIGKMYQGNGSGTNYIISQDVASVPFIGDDQVGLIATDAGNVLSLEEPPTKSAFKPITKCYNVVVGSGQIKVSVLNYHFKGSLTRFVNKVWNGNSGTIIYDMNNFGKYRFFGLEKAIESAAPELDENVTIGLQIQLDVGASLSYKNSTQMATYVEKIYG